MFYINGKPYDNEGYAFTTYYDGTPLMRCKVDETKDTYDITWCYDGDAEIVRLIFLVKHLKEHGIKNIRLYMPYIPNARYDRVKKPDEVFTLKYFAQIINGLGFEKVTALDPHSGVSEALLDNFTAISPDEKIRYAIGRIGREDQTPLVLFFPDEGAAKRYADLANTFGFPYVYAMKQRDWRTGKIQGLTLLGETEKVKGKNVLIIDDICSRGGTFYHSAKLLKDNLVKDVFLYVSHCENTVLEGDLPDSGLIKKIYTTDSIYRKEHPLIEVMPA